MDLMLMLCFFSSLLYTSTPALLWSLYIHWLLVVNLVPQFLNTLDSRPKHDRRGALMSSLLSTAAVHKYKHGRTLNINSAR